MPDKLISVWNGHVVLSGILNDPSIILMSKVSDPFDFDSNPPIEPDEPTIIEGKK